MNRFLALSLRTLFYSATCVATALPALPARAAADTAPAAAGEDVWPRTYAKDGFTVLMYHPQVDGWKDFAKIQFRCALVVTPSGSKTPVYGVLAVQADTQVDHDARSVMMTNLTLAARFSDLDPQQADALKAQVLDLLPKYKFIGVSLDRVLACVNDTVKPRQVKVDIDPPTIFYSDSPAILVVFLGQPQFKPVAGTSLMFAENTNWPVFLNIKESRYYLLNENSWLTTADPVNGPWTAVTAMPAEFNQLPADPAWNEVRQNLPGQAAAVPQVFVSTAPAEMIVTDGAPAFSPIPGTAIMNVSNPVMPLFLNLTDNNYYYLVAGRWFSSSTGMGGPWTAVSTVLPAEFAKIPPEHPLAGALASVPGTSQSRDAILLASVPHQVKAKPADAKPEVAYDGAPVFEDIPGTTVKFATNSRFQVLGVAGQFYCCYQGAWFVAAAPVGPWALCTAVPADVYTIPPTSPAYNTTYVQVADASNPDEVVYNYTDGYYGSYVSDYGVLVYGSGIRDYRNWYPCMPFYYSYGSGAYYNFSCGGFYRAGGYWYGPYSGAGWCSAYNRGTGAWARGGYAYGPNGMAWGRSGYNPLTDRYARQVGGATNGGAYWGRTAVAHDGAWATAGHVTGPDGNTVAGARNSSGQWIAGVHTDNGNTVAKASNGDLYAGHDGNVYRRNDDGQWQVRQNGNWNNVQPRPPQRNVTRPSAPVPGTIEPGSISRGTIAPPGTPAPARVQPAQSSEGQNQWGSNLGSNWGSNDNWQNSGERRTQPVNSFENGRGGEDASSLNREWSNRDRGESSYRGRSSSGGRGRR